MVPGLALIGFAAFVVAYTYALYPLLLKIVALRGRYHPATVEESGEWPSISLTIPAYNEAGQIEELLESVLHLDYPRDRIQILVVSDASDDGTDQIVERYADRGIELLRMPVRGGKSKAENTARPLLRGEIIVNTDASIRIAPDALKPLISRFRDPGVGLASGRDVSVTRVDGEMNIGESSYVGYEMWIRSLETDVWGIVGASGCFYAIRKSLHAYEVPEGLSRDFAAALVTRENGYRPVTVNEAVCYVPRAPSLKSEYRRKVRTMVRGMGTLNFKRHLLNPFREGVFAWMLFSHKVCRWASPWAMVAGLIGLVLLALVQPLAWVLVAGVAAVLALALVGWRWPEGSRSPKIFSMPAFLVAGNVAVLHASLKALGGGGGQAVWEPTRRDVAVRPHVRHPSEAASHSDPDSVPIVTGSIPTERQ
ncbi:MAG: glycosyltransferase [Gemmatimonadota bacterium]|jgi:cellulose synthase/poly-beta-1,6-N-acetylglucosamine synthase-like glycosyltransferase|nr:glycosyltransferase [Gemmatimonadota bacterium]